MSNQQPIHEGQILTGALFNEPMRVETVRTNGPDTWAVGLVGLQTERFRNVTLTVKELASLTIQETTCSYDGDGQLLLGLVGKRWAENPHLLRLPAVVRHLRYPDGRSSVTGFLQLDVDLL